MARLRRGIAWLGWLWLLPLGAAAEPLATGPMGLRTQGSFRELFLDQTLSDARPPRKMELGARWAFANDWSVPTTLARGDRRVETMDDEQADSLTLWAQLPWSARLSTRLEWRVTEHWGGWSDRVVEKTHSTVGVFDYERARFGRDELNLTLREQGGPALLALSRPTLAPGDLVARNQLHLFGGAGDRWAAALRLDVKAPVGSLAHAGGSGGWDAGGAVVGSLELTPYLTGHAMLSAKVLSGLPGAFPLQPRRWHAGAEASLVFHQGRWAVVLEDRLVSPLFEGGWERVDDRSTLASASSSFALFYWHNQVSLGLRWSGLTLWASEDVTPGMAYGNPGTLVYMANAPDIAIGISWLDSF